MININIKTDGAAFDENGYSYEVARILREIADKLELNGETPISANDSNGNRVVKIDYEQD